MTKMCPKNLCFPGFWPFSKKMGLLAARYGAMTFTRALGYAKRPLSVVLAFADARLGRRTLSQTHAFASGGHRWVKALKPWDRSMSVSIYPQDKLYIEDERLCSAE